MKELKYVVITGISKGLGKALANQFLNDNVRVIGCARNISTSNSDNKHLLLSSVDVTSAEQTMQWTQQVIEDHGVPDMVIQCAGTINKPGDIESLNMNDFSKVMDVNVYGVVNIMRGFLPAMKRANKGFIINVSSGWGRSAKEGLSPYCASKFAVEGLSESVSKETSGAVKVYALDPGDGIQTDMLDICLPDYYPMAPNANDWAKCAYQYLRSLWEMPSDQTSLTVDLSTMQSTK